MTRLRSIAVLVIGLPLLAAQIAVGAAAQGDRGFEQLERAAALIGEGRLEQAEAALSRLLAATPRDANALNLLGVVRARQGRAGEAEELFRRAVEASPSLVPAHVNLARALAVRGDLDAAAASARAALALDPSREDAVSILAGIAAGLTRAGRPDRALALVEAAGSARRSYPLLMASAEAHEAAGDRAGATTSYEAALAARPEDPRALVELARLARAAGESERALALLVRARRSAPDSPEVLYDFGWTALSLNLLFDAIPVLERLHREHPDHPGYLYALALARLNNREPLVAGELATRYVARWPEDARGHYLVGVIRYSLKEYASARDALERSLALRPFSDTLYYLGMAAYESGDEAAAESWLRRTLATEPGHAGARATIGLVLLHRKDYAAARAELERALELDPENLTAAHQLALVYNRLGDRERSRAAAERATALRRKREREQVVGLRLADAPRDR